MADALISVVFDRLTSFVQQCFQQNVGLVRDAAEDAKKLSTTFLAVKAMLEDENKKQVNDPLVKIWLEKLEDIACDIDDVLDEWSTEIGKSQLDTTLGGKRNIQSVLYSPSNVIHDWMQRNGIAGRIKDIRVRLAEIENEKAKFSLSATVRIRMNKFEVPKTTSMVNASEVFGRCEDKNIVMSNLLNEPEQEIGGVAIFSIVGMPGIGKTTAAQLAFNDDRVKHYFAERIWVSVSETFDEIRIANAIIEQVEGIVPSFIEWEPLQQKLCMSVMGKRFLLVLDDVWIHDFSKWNSLKLPLRHGAPGSRILVTTCNEAVSLMVGSTKTHTLGPLSEEDCWSLFSTSAFAGKTREQRESVEEEGRLIVKECEGWPHAAKTIGRLMLLRRTKQDWQNVLVNNRWHLPEVEEGMLLAPLLRSYYFLLPHLKRCLAYCAIFPKGCIIEKDYVIKLWMANGLLGSKERTDQTTKRKERRDPETIGTEYFDCLVSHSFFQDFKKDENGNILSCKMHGFVHYFTQSLPMAECFVMEGEGEEEPDFSKTRQLILLEKDKFPTSTYDAKSVRTLITRWNKKRLQTIPPELFDSLQRLRAVDLSFNSMMAIPREVGNLIHLRYLDLSGGPFQQLPEAVTSLYNLQTLKLINCLNLCKLPQGMENLVNLRHLEIDGTYSLIYLPKGVGKLKSLRTLSKFIVSEEGRGCEIQQLKGLNYLGGCLRIQGLGNVADASKAGEAELRQKRNLCALVLDFRVLREREGEDNNEIQERMKSVIEHLQPHQNLENLEILCYPGKRLPLFMGKLSCLEKLVIYRMNGVKCMGCELFGFTTTGEELVLFPKLKELQFHQMDEWELCHTSVNQIEYRNIVLAPSLRVLTLICCLKLKVMPYNLLPLTLLRELCICTCPNLAWTTSCLLLPRLEKLTLDGDTGVLSRSLSSRKIFIPNLRFFKIGSSPHRLLPKGLGQFTELQSLEIFCCHHIICMSDELHQLTMLQDLKIFDCPSLGPRCLRNAGEDWDLISHIPNIYLKTLRRRNGEIVYEDA